MSLSVENAEPAVSSSSARTANLVRDDVEVTPYYPEPALPKPNYLWPVVRRTGAGVHLGRASAQAIRLLLPTVASAALPAYKRSADYVLHSDGSPPIGLVLAVQTQFEVIVGQRFGELALRVISNHIQRNGFERVANEAAHEGQLLLGGQLAQDAVAFARDMHRDLL